MYLEWDNFQTEESLQKAKEDPGLWGITTMSAENNMDFTYGMDGSSMLPLSGSPILPMDPLFTTDENRVRREFMYVFENANMLESMLVSINHMMVDVCHFKYGITGFTKNIISFPQELNELKQLAALISSLEVGDIVNVRLEQAASTPEAVHRAQAEVRCILRHD